MTLVSKKKVKESVRTTITNSCVQKQYTISSKARLDVMSPKPHHSIRQCICLGVTHTSSLHRLYNLTSALHLPYSTHSTPARTSYEPVQLDQPEVHAQNKARIALDLKGTQRGHLLMGIGAFDAQLASTNESCLTAVQRGSNELELHSPILHTPRLSHILLENSTT